MKFNAKTIRLGLMVLAALDVAGTAALQYVEDNPGNLDWRRVLFTVGIALFAWLKKAPGDLTHSEAKQMAHEHASDVLAKASLPPAPIAQPSWDEMARASLVPPGSDRSGPSGL